MIKLASGRFDDGKDRHGNDRDDYEQRSHEWMGDQDEYAEGDGSGSSEEEDDDGSSVRGKYSKWRRLHINKDTIEFQMGGSDAHDAQIVVDEWRAVANNVLRISRTPLTAKFELKDVLRGLLRGLVSVVSTMTLIKTFSALSFFLQGFSFKSFFEQLCSPSLFFRGSTKRLPPTCWHATNGHVRDSPTPR